MIAAQARHRPAEECPLKDSKESNLLMKSPLQTRKNPEKTRILKTAQRQAQWLKPPATRSTAIG